MKVNRQNQTICLDELIEVRPMDDSKIILMISRYHKEQSKLVKDGNFDNLLST